MEWVESVWNDMDSTWIPCGMWGEGKDLPMIERWESHLDSAVGVYQIWHANLRIWRDIRMDARCSDQQKGRRALEVSPQEGLALT